MPYYIPDVYDKADRSGISPIAIIIICLIVVPWIIGYIRVHWKRKSARYNR